MKFKRTSAKNPCPICETTKGKCGSDYEKGLLYCMTYVDGVDHPLYRYVKPTVNEVWGIYAVRTDKDFEREKWLQQKQEREDRERELEAQRRQTCLDSEQRDIETRKILSQLTLTDGDRRYLLGRGVPLAVIERCRSVVQWQPLDNPVHVNLPGVSKFGKSLNCRSEGILVAIPDGQGHLSAMRLHDRYDKDRKYTWLSSRTRGIDPRLPSREYPIGYYEPTTIIDTTRIGVCEGMEFKAPVAAGRLGFPVIGFSGCNFAQAMWQLKQLAHGKTIVIVPDAGSTKNDNVYRSLMNAIDVFKYNEIPVEVAWWGQIEKKDGDIDETDKPIEFITVEKFQEIAKRKPPKNTLHQAFVNLTNKLIGTASGGKNIAKRLKTGLQWSKVDQYYKKGEGAKLYAELVRSGYKYILDNSATGTGKTHTVSQLKRHECFLIPDDKEDVMSRIVYCPPSHRNPTNAKIEEDWFETAARNNGYYVNYSKTTDLGSPYRESLNGLENVDDNEKTTGNCHQAEKFMRYYAAGRDTKGICGACEYREKCAVKKGDGFGYISESKKWIAEPLIRTSTAWLDKDKVIAALTGVILDEAGQVQWTIQKTIEISYILRLMDIIRKKDDKLHKKLLALEYGLRDLIDEGVPKFGYDTNQILSKIKLDESLIDDLVAIAAIETENGVSDKEIQPLFLTELIEMLLGKKHASLNLTENSLTIVIKNDRLIQACHAAKWLICQDATWSRSQMATVLGIDESEIYVIAQEQESVTNLVIEQWKGAGLLSNNRTDLQVQRVKQIRQILEGQHKSIGFIDWKRYGELSDLVHCGDSRGSNAYKEKDLVVSFGLSRPNMTAIRLEYESLTGNVVKNLDDHGYSEFYNHIVAANLVQEIGRLRANRRQNQPLKFILIGDGDISFLEEMGFDLVIADIQDKFPEIDFGWKGARNRYLALGMKLCRSMGRANWINLSLRKCAEMLERSAAALSKWVRRWFGVDGDTGGVAYERFKELVYAAIYGTNGQETVLDAEKQTYVGAIGDMLKNVYHCGNSLGKELKDLIEVVGWDVVLESVKRLENDYGIKLISRIFDVALQENGTA